MQVNGEVIEIAERSPEPVIDHRSYVEGAHLVIAHIRRVQELMGAMAANLIARGICHDQSKLSPNEAGLVIGKSELNKIRYGSAAYTTALQKVAPAIKAHYEANTHHPEHYVRGITAMSLFDLFEMLADWKAAGEESGGDMARSLEVNQRRYDIPPSLLSVLRATADEMGW